MSTSFSQRLELGPRLIGDVNQYYFAPFTPGFPLDRHLFTANSLQQENGLSENIPASSSLHEPSRPRAVRLFRGTLQLPAGSNELPNGTHEHGRFRHPNACAIRRSQLCYPALAIYLRRAQTRHRCLLPFADGTEVRASDGSGIVGTARGVHTA